MRRLYRMRRPQLIVVENSGADLSFTDNFLRPHTVAWRAVEPIDAASNRPIENATDVAKQIVCLIGVAAIDAGINDRQHITGARQNGGVILRTGSSRDRGRNLGYRSIRPARNKLPANVHLRLASLGQMAFEEFFAHRRKGVFLLA